jgi:hypothetical protein
MRTTTTKKRHIGACRLCRKRRVLRRSHLMPAALYAMTKVGGGGEDPVLVTAQTAGQTSRQFWAHLLCKECEAQLNIQGEQYSLSQVHDGRRFPLLERLNLAMPLQSGLGVATYSGRAMGIDTDRLAHFAMGIFWRASVHRWPGYRGAEIWKSLGVYEEDVRRYLLAETPFPAGMYLNLTVCTDWQSQGNFFSPATVTGVRLTGLGLLTRGLHFRLYYGPNLPEVIRHLCCATSPRRIIARGNCLRVSLNAFGYLMRTSKEAASLRQKS